MSALVRLEQGKAVADSRDVATAFGKQHQHVLRSIDGLLTDRPDLASNFGRKVYPVATGDGGKRHARAFDMDRKGFMLLVMGFTGEKALSLKVEWIDAFDAMEQALRAPRAMNDVDVLEDPDAVATIDLMVKKLAVVRETRRMFGMKMARAAWHELGILPGLAEAADPVSILPARVVSPLLRTVATWVEERCEVVPGYRVRAMDLYHAYLDWAKAAHVNADEIVSLTGFGRALTDMGVGQIRSGNVYRIGLKPCEG